MSWWWKKSIVYPRDKDKIFILEENAIKPILYKFSNSLRIMIIWKIALKWIQPTLKFFQWNSLEKKGQIKVDFSEN